MFHRYNWNQIEAGLAFAISSTEVIDSVAAVNGIPNSAAALASAVSPRKETRPAKAVGATTIGDE
ncbi:hypothetical protein D3C84_818500 [compost metagenome]